MTVSAVPTLMAERPFLALVRPARDLVVGMVVIGPDEERHEITALDRDEYGLWLELDGVRQTGTRHDGDDPFVVVDIAG